MKSFPLDISHGIILCKAKLAKGRRSIFVKLAVDTGASLSLISVEAALAIGIDPMKSKRHIEITTASGIVFVPVTPLPSLECFGARIKNVEVICHNLPAESPVEGLLGLNFLNAAKVVLNFSRGVIEI